MDDSTVLWILAESSFGVTYAYGVHRYTVANPGHPYVAFEVVAGVLGTVGITMLLMPTLVLPGIWFFVTFALPDWPQIYGAIHRNTTKQTRSASREAQRDETIDQLRRQVSDLSQQLTELQLEVGADD